MTMINPTPNNKPIDVPFTIKIADMDEAKAYLERQNAALQELIDKKDDYIIRLQNEVSSKTKAQQIITDIVKDINENIKELSLTEDDSFPLDTLKEIFEERGYDLDFKRLYKVEVVYTVKAQIEIEAEDADAAKEEVESDVSLIDISIDGNLIDWDVIDESVNSAEEA